MASGKDGVDDNSNKKATDAPPPVVPAKPDATTDETFKITFEDQDQDKEPETVSKADYMALQKQILDLQKTEVANQKEKDELERAYVFNELKTLNPKLAEINKDASAATLKTVIATAQEIKSDFPSLGNKKPTETKASLEDHDSMDYDFVNKKWAYQ